MSKTQIPEPQARPLDVILKELEGVVSRLESGDLPLEEALDAFERGVSLSREGERILAAAEKRVELLLEGRETDQETVPLDVGTSKTSR